MKGCLFGTLESCALQWQVSADELIARLSALSAACVAQGEQPGLALAYSIDFLSKQTALPGTYLGLYILDDRLVGAVLYHLDQQTFPSPVEHAKNHFAQLGRLAYAQLIVISPHYRGAQYAIYNELMNAAIAHADQQTEIVLCLLRVGNQNAGVAHLRRGWCRSGVLHEVSLNSRLMLFEYLLLNMRGSTASAHVELFRACADSIGSPYSLIALGDVALTSP